MTSPKPNCGQLNTFHCHCAPQPIEHNDAKLPCGICHPGSKMHKNSLFERCRSYVRQQKVMVMLIVLPSIY